MSQLAIYYENAKQRIAELEAENERLKSVITELVRYWKACYNAADKGQNMAEASLHNVTEDLEKAEQQLAEARTVLLMAMRGEKHWQFKADAILKETP